LSNRVRRSEHAAFGRRDHHQQRHCEHDVLIELQHRPANVPDELCPAITLPVTIFDRSPAKRSTQRGDRVGDRLQGLFRRRLARRDRVRGAMEIEPADMPDMRRDVHVRRVAG